MIAAVPVHCFSITIILVSIASSSSLPPFVSNLVRKPLKPGFLTTQLKLNIHVALLNLNHAHFSCFSGKRELHRSKTLPIIHPPKLIPNDNETTGTVASGYGQGQGQAQRKTSVPIIMCLQRRIKTSPGTTLTGT